MLSFTDVQQKAVDESIAYQSNSKYFKSEICQSELTNQSPRGEQTELSHHSLLNESVNSQAGNHDSYGTACIDGSFTSSAVIFNIGTYGTVMHEVCTLGKDLIVNNGMTEDDPRKASHNREFGKPILSTRFLNKERPPTQRTNVTHCGNHLTTTTIPNFACQRQINLFNKDRPPEQKANVTQCRNHLSTTTIPTFAVQKPQQTHNESSNSNSVMCKRCQKQFKSKYNLKRHQIFVHNKSSKHQCMQCDKYLPNACDLKDHMLFHEGTRNYPCKICHKRFFRKSYLKDHMRFHSGERPFTCELCEEKFAHKRTLQAHMRSHTG